MAPNIGHWKSLAPSNPDTRDVNLKIIHVGLESLLTNISETVGVTLKTDTFAHVSLIKLNCRLNI